MKKSFLVTLVLLAAFSANLTAESEWREISTKHFTFVYQAPEKSVALQFASFAEDVYQDVTNYFGSYPAHVIAVVRTTTDEFNGFFSFLPRRLDLFVAPPTTTVISAYSTEYLRNLLAHEFTHYVHLTQKVGAGAWQWLYGPDAAWYNEWFLPGWVVEGITTNTEGLFATGGRARNPFFEMEYKAPILEHHMWTYDQAAYGSFHHPYDRWYPSGFLMVDYLREHWGEKAFNTIYKNIFTEPFSDWWGYNRSLEAYTKLSCSAFFQAAQNFMLKKFATDAKYTPGVQVSPAGEGDWYLPYVTSRGWLGYAIPFHEAPGIYLEHSGKAPRLLLPVVLTDPYSFGTSADGSSLIFSSYFTTNQTSEPESDTARSELWLDHQQQLKRLTTSTGFYSPRLSPDGKTWWAFQRRGTEQVLVQGDLTGKYSVIYQAPGHLLQTLEVSPDGHTLAFAENIQGQQVLTIFDNGNVKERLNIGSAIYFPRWVDADHLTFSTDKAGRLDLWLVDLAHKTYQVFPRDPVGDASGILVQGKLVYQTYTYQGWTLKRFNDLSLVTPQPLPEVATVEAQNQQPVQPRPEPLRSLKSKPFVDVAPPDLWLPFPLPYQNATQNWNVGVGAFMLGNSYLDTQAWQLGVAYFPQLNNLVTGLLSYSWRLPGWQALFSAQQNLVQASSDSEVLDSASISASIPWGEWDTPLATNRSTAQFATGVTHDALQSGVLVGGNSILTAAGINWVSSNKNTAIDQPYGSWYWGDGFSVQATLPVWSQPTTRLDEFNTLEAGLPFGPLEVQGRITSTADSQHSLYATTPSYSPAPLNPGTSDDWRSDFKLNITWPWGFYDLNVVGLGIPLQGLSVWGDFGGQGKWKTQPVWDQGVTYGTEINTVLIIGQMHLPFFIGVAAQVEPVKGGFLNPQFYLGFTATAFDSGLTSHSRELQLIPNN